MSIGSALGRLALIGLARTETILQFYLLWSGALGLAMALTLYPVTFTVVANWFVRKRGTALAILTLVGGLSSPLYIPLAGTLVAHVGWRTTLVVLGLTQLLIALPLHAFLLRRHPEDMGLSPDGEAISPVLATHGPLPGATLAEALHSAAFWLLTASLSLVFLGSTVIFVHQIAFLIGRGYNAVFAATLSGLLGLVSLPGRYILNVLSSRISPQKLLMLSVTAQAVGLVILVLASSPGWLILYVVVYGVAYGAFSPLRASVMADHFGRRAYGLITAVQGIPMAICAGLGPVAAGWLYDGLHQYAAAFWLCAAAFLLVAIGIALVPRPEKWSDHALSQPEANVTGEG
jgi:MFS family permease